MKNNQPVLVQKNERDANHSIYVFQPNQVYRLINLIVNNKMRVMANISGTMSAIGCLCSDVDEDFFVDDLRRLCRYKAPVVVVKIQRHYKRVIIMRVDQKGHSN